MVTETSRTSLVLASTNLQTILIKLRPSSKVYRPWVVETSLRTCKADSLKH